MDLLQFLDEKKTDILDAWVRQVLEGYSPDAARIFGREKDRFANPIGYNVRQGLTELYDALAADPDAPKAGRAVLDLLKVRAVQEFTPSQAVGFVYLLKGIVRRETGRNRELLDRDALHRVDTGIDCLVLQIFDLYMQCREQLHKVRLQEIQQNRALITDMAKCPSALIRENRK
ncbi:MAG: RsbRD N-terminal domain-containing protein [Thermodesulfobacteriota bacterium]